MGGEHWGRGRLLHAGGVGVWWYSMPCVCTYMLHAPQHSMSLCVFWQGRDWIYAWALAVGHNMDHGQRLLDLHRSVRDADLVLFIRSRRAGGKEELWR